MTDPTTTPPTVGQPPVAEMSEGDLLFLTSVLMDYRLYLPDEPTDKVPNLDDLVERLGSTYDKLFSMFKGPHWPDFASTWASRELWLEEPRESWHESRLAQARTAPPSDAVERVMDAMDHEFDTSWLWDGVPIRNRDSIKQAVRTALAAPSGGPDGE